MKNEHKTLLYLLAMMLLVLLLIFNGKTKSKRLEKNFQLTEGWVLGTSVLKNGGTSIKYYFEIEGKEIDGLGVGGNIKCEMIANRLSNMLKGKKMPIVYERDAPQNNRLLVFKSEYAKFRVAVPQALREVVEEMSKCEE
jgi:hypothetical protein